MIGIGLEVVLYLFNHLYISAQRFRNYQLLSIFPKSMGCAPMAFSLGEGRDEALCSTFSELPIAISISEKQGLCSVPLLKEGLGKVLLRTERLHPEPYSRISGIITHSVRNDFTGFANAALIA